jgi:hypothetical protein
MDIQTTRKNAAWLPALLLIIALILITWLAYPGLQRDRSERVNRTVIVTINHQDVYFSRFQDEVLLQSLRQALSGQESQPINRLTVLNRLVADTLMLQAADAADIQVSEEGVQAAIESIYTQYGLSPEDFQKKLDSQGVDFEIFEESIHNFLKILLFTETQILNGVPPGERQIVLSAWVSAHFQAAEMEFDPAFLGYVNQNLQE